MSRSLPPTERPHSGIASRLELLAAALLFSTGGAAIKATSLTAWQVAGFRSGIAAVALLALLPAARRALRRRWGWPLVAVGAAHGVTMLLFVLGNKLTTAANTIFLQSTAPLWVLLLAPWLLRESVRRRDLVYMAALALGLGLFFVGQRAPDALAPNPLAGNLIAAASGLTWGLTLLGLRSVGREEAGDGGDLGALAVVLGNSIAFVVALPLALGDRAALAAATGTDWGLVAFLGVVQIAVAYAFLTRGIRRVGAFEASLLLLVEPVLNPIWAWLVHGEQPGPWGLAGGAAILGATLAKTALDVRRARHARAVSSRA